MIGVTIGIGNDHLFYAKEAAKRFSHFTGLNTFVMTEEYLKEVEHYNIFSLAKNNHDKILFLKFFIFDFFADDVVYFDCDYCAVDYWRPDKMFDGRFIAARDRIHSLYGAKVISSNVHNYFNGGLMIASYKHHRRFFDRCVKQANTVKFKFGDQCIFNAIAENVKLPIKYIDKRYNCLDYAGVMTESDVKGVHNSFVYNHYKENTQIEIKYKYKWNLIEMAGVAGQTTLVFEDDEQKPVFLEPDGLTSEGNVWFITDSGEFYICENYVDNLRKVKTIY